MTAPLRSFVSYPPDSDFPLEHLPYGVFRPAPGAPPRVGTAIGAFVLDLSVIEDHGLLVGTALGGRKVFRQPSLNEFLRRGPTAWRSVRACLQNLLSADEARLRDNAELRAQALLPRDRVELLLPVQVANYTDFYSSREHATNVGTMLRGAENALYPNWLHLPVAYHGRASSVVVSGTGIRRPLGQTKADAAPAPTFGPSRALDYELELGFIVGQGNDLGTPIPCRQAPEHLFGAVLVNDWSARDIQKWEYVPLGPFLAKNFATSISAWVTPLEALLPFRVANPAQDPPPLPYLQSDPDWTFNIELEVLLLGPGHAEPAVVCRTSARHLYWNICQQVAHHTVNGCNLCPGDLLASGTISGPTPESRGCLLERTWGGQQPLTLADGTTRRFLEDGDTLVIRGWCQGDGFRIGLGEVRGTILPAGG